MKYRNKKTKYFISQILLLSLLLLIFVISSTGCKKNTSHLSENGGFQLPLNGFSQIFKTQVAEQVESVYSDNLSLSSAENFLRNNNNIKESSPRGHFILDSTMKAVGYSLFLFDHEDSRFIDINNTSNTIHEFIPKIQTSYCSYCKLKQDKIKIRTLKGLNQINSLEFIDFASCTFAAEIWGDLQSMSEEGSLRGISLTNGERLLNVRDNHIAPKIKGLAVHLTNTTRLKEFGLAFPSLTFLCIAIPDRNSINDLFRDDILKQYFPNLKGLVIGSSTWPYTEFNNFPKGRESPSAIRFSPQRIPPGIEYICIDGNLMALADMMNYDEFGAKLRYKSGRSSKKAKLDRNIEVVYMGYGFSAGGGARSMNAFEYGMLDKYWRDIVITK